MIAGHIFSTESHRVRLKSVRQDVGERRGKGESKGKGKDKGKGQGKGQRARVNEKKKKVFVPRASPSSFIIFPSQSTWQLSSVSINT
jgi:hypothetical protein